MIASFCPVGMVYDTPGFAYGPQRAFLNLEVEHRQLISICTLCNPFVKLFDCYRAELSF